FASRFNCGEDYLETIAGAPRLVCLAACNRYCVVVRGLDHSLRQLQIAAYWHRATVDNMLAARNRALDYQPAYQARRLQLDGFAPSFVGFAAEIEVNELTMTTDGAADDAQRVMRRKPAADIGFCRQPGLEFLPAADSRPLFFQSR